MLQGLSEAIRRTTTHGGTTLSPAMPLQTKHDTRARAKLLSFEVIAYYNIQ